MRPGHIGGDWPDGGIPAPETRHPDRFLPACDAGTNSSRDGFPQFIDITTWQFFEVLLTLVTPLLPPRSL